MSDPATLLLLAAVGGTTVYCAHCQLKKTANTATEHRPLPLTRQANTPSQTIDPALLARYAGKASPDFIARYADILRGEPKMMGWDPNKSTHLWTSEERARYLRDGSPKNKADIVRIMGTWGNPRQY